MGKLSSAFMMALLVTVLSIEVEAQFEEFVPYIPDSSQVGLIYWRHSGISYMNVTIEFPNTGFNISSWGTPSTTANNISVDAEVWRYTGLSFPVIIAVSHTYNLDDLPCGEYNFFFEVWESSVKNATFVVSPEIIVPDDYSSIQEAINAAGGGDTVFVRSGTYLEQVVVNKSISLVGEDVHTAVIDGCGVESDIIAISSDKVNLSAFTIQNTSKRGLVMLNSTGCAVTGNVMQMCENGLVLANSHFNFICSNKLLNNTVGIGTSDSCNNTIKSNLVKFSYMWGMGFGNSCFNIVTGNIIEHSLSQFFTGAGLELDDNTVGNMIYHNNFIHNSPVNAKDNGNNIWDNGCEGNYWWDYTGTDADGDGIGDTPYRPDPVYVRDDYPLMNPYWNSADVNHDLKVDIYDVVLISGAYLSTPSDPKWNPHCDIVEPCGIIDIYDVVLICDSYGEEHTS